MRTAHRVLRGVAIASNALAAAWWVWASIQVTSSVGPAALISSGGLLWMAFTVPPIAALAALTSIGRRRAD
jgi:hypothetical protein